ncbi:PilN domain-containing protein [Okeanomitos corallinicola TIOX110]|uniref:PilN domain-containing protein n=1 Tax=Okeanomitos corallinicola TIOX110 TaxID=3133117 RepID=A0ABZ2UMG2_9CYAN
MYSLDINFLKDRSPTEVGTQPTSPPINLRDYIPVGIGLGAGLILPALSLLGLWFIEGQNSNLEQQIAKSEQEIKQLDGKIADINKIKAETAVVKDQTDSLVTVFNRIRPWSAMLKEFRERIPANVQVENIKQIPPELPSKSGQAKPQTPTNDGSIPAGSLEITGYARSFTDVNDFLLSMGQSKLLDASKSRISTAELVDAPPITGAIPPDNSAKSKVKIKPPQVVKYTIKATLSSVPASELISELENKGTVGLVNRIRSLQKTGALPQ